MLQTKQLTVEEIKGIDKDKGILRAIISSGKPDRHGERIDQKSWMLDEYMKNPVVLWSHDHKLPSIGKALSLEVVRGKLEALIQFAIEENEFAKTIYNLYAGGYQRAFSVGFIPGEQKEEEDGTILLKNNLLYEFSAVNVGADALALAKSKGLDVSLLEGDKSFETATESHFVNATTNYSINPSFGTITVSDEPWSDIEITDKTRKALEDAKDAIEEALSGVKTTPKNNKLNRRRILNKAVRELLKAKKI